MSFHLYFLAIFISLWGSTHDSADCCSDHRFPAARNSFKCEHDWCMAGSSRPGGSPPPNKNPGYAGELDWKRHIDWAWLVEAGEMEKLRRGCIVT